MSLWVDGCGGRVHCWCWGLNMQLTCVVLGIHGCWWTHITLGRWLWWKGMPLVLGTRHAANACCVGHAWVLVSTCRCGSMAVVEGHVIGAGNLSCSQCMLCWAYMGVGGCMSSWVDGCGGRACCWCWGLNMQPTHVVLGVCGC